MAAPQWSRGKMKTIQAAKAQFGHSIKSRRQAAQHTNPHINKALTHLNWNYRGYSYQDCCKAYDDRMSAIDQGRAGSGANTRVLMQCVVIYPPAGLVANKGKLRDWFQRAGELAEARFGPNMIDMAVHMDEVHEYIEPGTGDKRISREHGHLWLVPEVGGKLNGKQFSSRAVITGFNDELQEMSVKEFGCPMMDGSKAKGGRKVEVMKAESRAAEIIAQAEKQAQEEAQKAVEAAQAQAREIIAQAEKQAQEASRRAVEAAQAQAAEIVAQAEKQAQEVQEAQAVKLKSVWEDIQTEANISLAVLERCKSLQMTLEQQAERQECMEIAKGQRKTAAECIERPLPALPAEQPEDEDEDEYY